MIRLTIDNDRSILPSTMLDICLFVSDYTSENAITELDINSRYIRDTLKFHPYLIMKWTDLSDRLTDPVLRLDRR